MSELLCERIRRLRQSKKLSARALGEMLGLTKKAVQGWECAYNMPQADRVPDIARALGVSTDYLLTGREAPRHAALIEAVRRAGTRDPVLAALVERI